MRLHKLTEVQGCRYLLLLTVVCLGMCFPGVSSNAAAKVLQAVKVGSFAEKTRVVLQLDNPGFYEVVEQPESTTLVVKLYDFTNTQVAPEQLLDEQLIRAITVAQEGQYLKVAIQLSDSLYTYQAHLFESPPMLVVDIAARPPAVDTLVDRDEVLVEDSGRLDTAGKPAATVEQDLALGGQGAKALVPATLEKVAAVPSLPQASVPEETAVQEVASVDRRETGLPEAPPQPLAQPKPVLREDLELPEKAVTGEPAVDADADAAPPAVTADPDNTLYEQGLQYYLDNEMSLAMEMFMELMTSYPDSSLVAKAQFRYNDALSRLALTEHREGLHEIIGNYLHVVRKFPDDSDAPWALLQIGRFYEQMGFSYEAEAVYQFLIHQYPHSNFVAAAWYAQANINYLLKRYQKALDAFQQLSESFPCRGFAAEAAYYQGHCQYHLGEYQLAVRAYEKAMKTFPDYGLNDPMTIYLLGSASLALSQHEQAREYLLKMRNLFPEDDRTNLALAKVGESFIAEGRFAEGVEVLATVIHEYPETDGEIIARLDIARWAAQNDKLAESQGMKPYEEFLDPGLAYRYIVAQYPENSLSHVARLRLGELLYEQHRYAEARSFFDQLIVLQVDPEIRSVAFDTLRKLLFDELQSYFKQQNFAAMVALQEQYGTNFLPRPTAMYPFFWLAEAMRHQGLYAGALKIYGALQGCTPSREELLAITWGMVSCHLKLGEFGAAGGLLKTVDVASLDNRWWVKMKLLEAEIMVGEEENTAALDLLSRIHSRLADDQVVELVQVLALTGTIRGAGGDVAAAVDAYRQALAAANAVPQMIDPVLRTTVISALARELFVKGDYRESLDSFQQVALFVDNREILAELLYWQGLCYAGLGQESELSRTVETLQKLYPTSNWASMATSIVKDFEWRTKNRSLQ
ncbi:MAG: tetratricopeptide repeat protein [Deltaproteobacteria bacterium]|nr:tetratricopeptide repeat protein [Candidatus Anaeroferrophillus wilburensis]MBN2888478.1 tetratricopeptide repeat protein [Deltaproteobacteria bacterium]